MQGLEAMKQHQQQRLPGKSKAGRKSGKSIFSNMSAEPVQVQNTSAALGVFGSDIAHPY